MWKSTEILDKSFKKLFTNIFDLSSKNYSKWVSYTLSLEMREYIILTLLR